VTANPIRVLVVDDSAFMRTVITQMLAGADDIEVVGQAADGKTGLQMARDLKPDVITLDVEMPVLSGLEMLRVLMSSHPTPVIMLSTLTHAGAQTTMQALELGAVDYLPKNMEGGPLGMRKIAPLLIDKVRAVGSGATREALKHAQHNAPARPVAVPKAAPGAGPAGPFRVVGIGASTGGPTALCELIPALPADLNAAILVVQHMPPGFTRALAERLDRLGPLSVSEAREGAPLKAGTIHVAPGSRHLAVVRDTEGLKVHLTDTPKLPMMPSVDVLFNSLATVCPASTLGVVLTGMGTDGCAGAGSLVRAGAPVVAQAERGCLVFGMPRAVAEAGLAARVVELEHMAEEIYMTANTALRIPVA
jgi:two-component system chemotaxis response regulator CheB